MRDVAHATMIFFTRNDVRGSPQGSVLAPWSAHGNHVEHDSQAHQEIWTLEWDIFLGSIYSKQACTNHT